MPITDMPYLDDTVDSQADTLDAGQMPGNWRALHWGLYDDPGDSDDSPEHYGQAAEAMTARIVEAAEITAGGRIADVGCGFGGTIDHVAERHPGCSFVGLNIDERQLRLARRLLAAEGRAAGPDTPFVTADGCRLPLADRSFDHVLAVECVFHFPSRKTFFKEAARILRPGGTLALSDFVFGPGAFVRAATMAAELQIGNFFGRHQKPLTSTTYARLGRSVGLDVLVDDDVTTATLPTYRALRRAYAEQDMDEAVHTITGCEALARDGGWQYHVLAFRKRESD
jgi:SAM-dependent methyltransferase